MNDMTKAAEPKSDQQNAEDYLSGVTKTIKITKVTIKSGEQPVTINFEGDNGKPYKPCKTMCKVMVSIWGADANKYIGKSMTLYGDPTVTWGGMAVGGIRISHMSDMGAPKTMALAANRASKKLITVNPLVVTADKPKTGKEPSQQPTADTAMGKVHQSLHDELSAHCLGDREKANELCREMSFYVVKGKDGEPDKEYRFELDKLPTVSEKWAGSALGKLRKKVEAETAAQTKTDGDDPF